LLLLITYTIYQPAAAFAVIPMLARMWRGFELNRERLRGFAMGMGMLVLTAAIYFVGFKIFVAVFHPGGQAARGEFTKDILGNLRFVVTQVLWSGVTGWFQFHSTAAQYAAAFVVIIVIVGGCVIRPWKSFAIQMCGLACVVTAVFFTVLNLLLLKEQIFAFRLQTALHGAIALMFMVGLERWLRMFSPTHATKVRAVAFALLICSAAILTRYHFCNDFVIKNKRELSALRRGVAGWKDFPKILVFITPAQAVMPGDSIGEFRDLTVSWSWVAPSMLELLFIETLERGVPLHEALNRHATFSVNYGPPNPDSLPVLNGFALVNGEPSVIHDPYWGDIHTNRNGWCYADWFGVFDNRRFPAIYHAQLGWLQCSGKGGDDFWFGNQKNGWFWTTPKSYPYLMFKDSGKWFFLSPGFSFEPNFCEMESKQWTTAPQSFAPATKKQ
jgi:hypothetical protein